MKKIVYLSIIGILFLFSSCASHKGLTFNTNNHTTQVLLSKKNYKIVDKVQGESEAMYILGIGGLSRKAMVAEAKADMVSKADIIGSSKAIINETVEVKHTHFPFVRKYKVIVSAYIIEFTE
jgi:hypothetical protein